MRTLQELNLASREFMVEDRRRSWRLFMSTWALLLMALALTAFPAPWPWRTAASITAGLLILRMFMFYHDALHDAIFRDSPLAKGILWTYGILILNPANVWKRSHNYHHQHNAQMATASIGSFPVMTVDQYQRAAVRKRAMYRLARHPLTILLGYVTIFLIGMCLKSLLTDWRRHWDSALALVLHFAIGVGLYRAGGGELLLFSFLLPMFLSTALGGYLFYIQHNFPDVEMRPREEWDYVFAALRSSSFMTGNRLVHWFTGNIGYHHVHHLNARIPFYRLPEAMAAIVELHSPRTTSLRPRDIRRCLQLKLWDPQSGRMVGFPKFRAQWLFIRPIPRRDNKKNMPLPDEPSFLSRARERAKKNDLLGPCPPIREFYFQPSIFDSISTASSDVIAIMPKPAFSRSRFPSSMKSFRL